MSRERVLAEVSAERDRQDRRWGEQNHPDGTGPKSTPLVDIVKVARRALDVPVGVRHYAAGLANRAKEATDHAEQRGDLTYRDVLSEEVFEAYAEEDPVRLRAELVQVAAVAVAWIEKLDRERGVL